MRSNILLIIAVIFCAASVGFVLWNMNSASTVNNYWASQPQSSGVWLDADNSHVAAVYRQERFTGIITAAKSVEDSPDGFMKVDILASNIEGKDPKETVTTSFVLPLKVDSTNLYEQVVETPTKNTFNHFTKLEALQEIQDERKGIFSFELVSQALTGTKFDYLKLLSLYYP